MTTTEPIDMSYNKRQEESLARITSTTKGVQQLEQKAESRIARDRRRSAIASALGRRTSRDSKTSSRDRSTSTSTRESIKWPTAEMASSPDEGDVEAVLKFPNFAQRSQQSTQVYSEFRGRSPQQRPLVKYEASSRKSLRDATTSDDESSLDLDLFDFEKETTMSRQKTSRDVELDSSSDSDAASVTSSTQTAVGAECPDCERHEHAAVSTSASKASLPLSRLVADGICTRPLLPSVPQRRGTCTSSDLDMIWDDDDAPAGQQYRSAKSSTQSNIARNAEGEPSARKLGRPVRSATTVEHSLTDPLANNRRATTSVSPKEASLSVDTQHSDGKPRSQGAETLIRFAKTRARLHRSGSLVSPLWHPHWAQMCLASTVYQHESDATSIASASHALLSQASVISRRWSHHGAERQVTP